MNLTTNKIKTTAIVLAVVVLLSLVTYGILKFSGVTDKFDEKLAEQKLSESIDPEISAEAVVLTPLTARMYASKLYSAMDGWGTDEEAIYEVFSNMTSRSDVLYLIKTFGVHDRKNLVEWIVSELSAKEREKLNRVLSDNNVNYQF